MPFTALMFTLTGSVVLANLLDGLVQFVLLILAFQLCWRALGLGREAHLAYSLTVVAGISFLLCTAWRIEIFYPTVWKLFQPQTHIGTLVLVMFGAALCIRLFRRTVAPCASKVLLALLVLVSILGAMSDPLYIPQMAFAITITAAAFVWLGLLRLNDVVLPLVTTWVGILVGRILNSWLFSVTDISAQSGITLDRFSAALQTFLGGAFSELRRRDLLHISAALWLLVAIGGFLWLLRRLALHKPRNQERPDGQTMVVFFLMFSALSGLGSAGAIIVGGSNGLVELKDYRWSADHYLHSIFYGAAFGWALPLSLVGASSRRFRVILHPAPISCLLGAVVLIPAVYAFSVPSSPVPLHRYSPPLVRYLDSQATRYGLQVGAAGYWNARPVTLFSRQGLRALSVFPSMEPNPWVSNRYWYTGTSDGSKKAPQYTFVILDEPLDANRKMAVEKLGSPDEDLNFRGTRILVYKPAISASRQSRLDCTRVLGLATELLGHIGDSLEIPAACLSGGVGEITGTTRVATPASAKPGLLAYGPYILLPAGRYVVTMHYQINHQTVGVAPTYEIGYFCCGSAPAVVLSQGTMQSNERELRTQISVSRQLAARGLEFRIQYMGGERMVFENVIIQRDQ